MATAMTQKSVICSTFYAQLQEVIYIYTNQILCCLYNHSDLILFFPSKLIATTALRRHRNRSSTTSRASSMRPNTSNIKNSTQDSWVAGLLKCGAPRWRITYSVQYTALSCGVVSWSLKEADITDTVFMYLYKDKDSL